MGTDESTDRLSVDEIIPPGCVNMLDGWAVFRLGHRRKAG